jgi:hypothetical protein
MPWMGVGVYFPASARAGDPAAFTGFEDFDDRVDFVACLLAALLRAVSFFAAARFFMARTLPPARASVNEPADATARR